MGPPVGPPPFALERRKHAGAAEGVVVGNQHKQRAVDAVFGTRQGGSAQDGASILKLDVVGQVAWTSGADLGGVLLGESPVGRGRSAAQNFLTDTD